MMGDLRGNPNMFGLIPRLCFSLFESLEAKNRMNPENYFHEVFFSHLEIYNENVRDLLVETKPGPSSQHTFLKVREHPNTGVFVAGLTKVQVRTFEEVMSLIQFGDRNRTVASTNSNKHSSRSHAVVTLTVLQRMRQSLSVKDSSDSALLTAGLEQKISLCHCVDLAVCRFISSVCVRCLFIFYRAQRDSKEPKVLVLKSRRILTNLLVFLET